MKYADMEIGAPPLLIWQPQYNLTNLSKTNIYFKCQNIEI